ncbi:carboxy terminal-processing peptidase [Moraxella sp. FZLJ2107]|uniref:carboxy terminal-processing peptidase n=1 Tax=unclassified Moraxella TaxID=2685852 RepID=UPI0020C91C53|nr:MULTISPECIES: carboxy terminal-processing peptidase [unclassified Moraxella]UTO04753.1 carboxy terminal-processing peptidase [Moraxella sp. FZLJ2107]UTO21481.1 carboxy terminal-processing peptidase [Moraxella sp. FZLJ2109]
MSKRQYLLSGIATAVAGVIITQSYAGVANAADQAAFSPSPEQRITARQVGILLDRAHYLDERMDEQMGNKILTMYFDKLDPNHTLFLQSDIDEFTAKYGASYAQRLLRGDLSAGIEIFERYRTRSNEYYDFAKNFLAKPINLNTDQSIVIDREDAPHFGSKQEQHAYWQNQLTYSLINLTISQEDDKAKDQAYLDNPELSRGQDLVKAESRTPTEILLNRLTRQQEQLQRLKNDEIMEYILDSATLTYDPHSNYFAPVQAQDMQIQNSLQLEGIGVSIRPDRKNPDYIRIISLVDGGPAAKSGQVRANDLIIGVAQDGEAMVDTVGYTTREIVALIRGKRGTNVTIRVKQPNTPDSQARTVTLTRDVIQQEESGVQHRIIEVPYEGVNKRVGVLEIPSFYLNFQARREGLDASQYRSVSNDTEKALKDMTAQGIDGLVVDLRNNPGGSLDEVAKMLGFFIKEGPLVQIRDNRGNVRIYRDGDGGKQLYQGDMAVLVNLGSASASEIFAAAIQDYGLGLIVGSTTTGKGSAQAQRDDLALGSMTITQNKFYRVNGGSTQNKGVVPDVELVNIYKGMEFGEREYKNPLPWDTIASTNYTAEGKYSQALIETLNEQSQARQAHDPQFIFLNKLNDIRALDDDKKPAEVSLNKRRAKLKDIEDQTLAAENARRQATGETPFTSWSTYQANLDAIAEERAAMKENERPKLPESEAYVLEAAHLMFDADKPQTAQAKSAK